MVGMGNATSRVLTQRYAKRDAGIHLPGIVYIGYLGGACILPLMPSPTDSRVSAKLDIDTVAVASDSIIDV